jgi:hypothetical protein
MIGLISKEMDVSSFIPHFDHFFTRCCYCVAQCDFIVSCEFPQVGDETTKQLGKELKISVFLV